MTAEVLGEIVAGFVGLCALAIIIGLAALIWITSKPPTD